MTVRSTRALPLAALLFLTSCGGSGGTAQVGVGAPPPAGAEVLFDGTRESLDANWIYWEGPRFSSSMPIKWRIVDDPVDTGTAVMTWDPAAEGGRYGAADIVKRS